MEINVNRFSEPSQLKITDIRVCNINGVPKHCPLIKIYTNQGIVGYGEVRDASSATYALILKSRFVGENPCNVDKLFRRIKQFGGHSRQGGGVSGIEIALWDLAGKAWGVPIYQLLGGKFRDKVRMYCDTDVDGKHTGTDMGHALKKRMEQGKREGRTGTYNQWVIDSLVEGDVAVIDMYDKIYKGTFLGGNLTTAVKNKTKTDGAVVWGGVRDVEQMVKIETQVYYRGIDPTPIREFVMTGFHTATRIGNAIVMPGDIAPAALLLCSEESRYITGKDIIIDGGMHL